MDSAGAALAGVQPLVDSMSRSNDLSPATPLVLDVFPSATRIGSFLAYDDDGHSYDYEKDGYFRQEITATRSGHATNIEIAAATGAYKPHFPSYLLRIHQASVGVTNDGQMLRKFPSANAFESSREPGWFSSTDRFGAVTEVRIATDANPHTLKLALR